MRVQKRKALVIDDDPLIREILSVYLQSQHFDVAVAGDGLQAMPLLENDGVPSLAFVDMLMPGKEGIETIASIKKRVPDIKIIAISGGGVLPANELLRYAEKLGADDSISKPFNFEDLDIKINAFFKG